MPDTLRARQNAHHGEVVHRLKIAFRQHHGRLPAPQKKYGLLATRVIETVSTAEVPRRPVGLGPDALRTVGAAKLEEKPGDAAIAGGMPASPNECCLIRSHVVLQSSTMKLRR